MTHDAAAHYQCTCGVHAAFPVLTEPLLQPRLVPTNWKKKYFREWTSQQSNQSKTRLLFFTCSSWSVWSWDTALAKVIMKQSPRIPPCPPLPLSHPPRVKTLYKTLFTGKTIKKEKCDAAFQTEAQRKAWCEPSLQGSGTSHTLAMSLVKATCITKILLGLQDFPKKGWGAPATI